MNRSLTVLLWLALGFAAGPARAAAYTFPTSMPAGCSGSAGNYSCGNLTLANSDTVTIAAPRPATIAVNGNLSVNSASINAGGLASDLTLTVTGTLSVGNAGRVNAQVTAASVSNAAGRAVFGASVTTSGTLSLGASASVSQCVQTTSMAAITLGNGATVGGVCCWATGSCNSSCVVNNSGAAMPALCVAPPSSPSTAGRFNAFETGTAATSVNGVIHTKVAGTPFTVSAVVVNTAGTGLATSFAGNVKVELLDSSDNSGALAGSTGCRSSWAVAAGTASSTLSFAASDQGRKNIALSFANAWRDARVRITYPAAGTPTAIGCSTDNFAIRPANFASFSATDATLLTAGTTRTLANSAVSGGNVHKAGQPFTVRATAVNGAGSPATTSNYTGTPIAFASNCAGAACTGLLGVLTLPTATAAGVVSTSNATYTEAGAFSLQLVDAAFASVDAADGSTPAEMSITSPTITVGRFVPDHFEIVSLITPVLRTFNSSTCPVRSFTYMGQPFGYATAPQASVLARNLAGATTANYPSAKLGALTITQAYTPLIAATPGVDSSGATLPTITANNNGTATLATQASDTLKIVRPTTTPLAAFSANIALAWRVTDSSETGTGNGSITTPTPLNMASIAFDMGNEFRFGVLKLNSAYGSELINMAVPLELQYWNGTAFATNAADQCSTLSPGSVALGTYRGNLAACKTAPGAASVAFASGRGLLRMLPPGSGNSGSADLTVNLGAVAAGQQCSAVGAAATAATTDNLPWLQGKGPAAATYNVNPSGRISFGQYRSPLIHLREVY